MQRAAARKIPDDTKSSKSLIRRPIVGEVDLTEGAVRRVDDRLVEDGLPSNRQQAGHLVHGGEDFVRVGGEVAARGVNGSFG